MKIYTHAEQGKRDYQQDRFLVKDNLLVVCDGMGGHANGELAAEEGINNLNECSFEGEVSPFEVMSAAIEIANENCINARDGRGSTVTAIYVDYPNHKLHIAHAGDSRAYILKKDGSVYQATTDHNDPYGYITSSIGFLSQIDREIFSFESGDQILIVSDGVSGGYSKTVLDTTDKEQSPWRAFSRRVVTDVTEMLNQIIRAKNEGRNPAEHLCHDAISRGSTDNCTAILAEL